MCYCSCKYEIGSGENVGECILGFSRVFPEDALCVKRMEDYLERHFFNRLTDEIY